VEDLPPDSVSRTSTSGTTGTSGARTRLWRAVAVAAALIALPVFATPGSASALRAGAGTQAGAPGAAGANVAYRDPARDLDALDRKAAKLAKQYRGGLAELDVARQSARKAAAEARDLNARLTAARRLVANIAATNYMTTPQDPAIAMFGDGDPRAVLDRAAIINHMARDKSEQVRAVGTLAARAQAAQRKADQRVAKAKKLVAELERNRRKVQSLINKFRPQSRVTGGSGLTSRMVRVRNEIDRRYGPFRSIGCFRAGPPDHGTGNACDFMVSFGTMPSASSAAQCDRVGEWVMSNASRMGIKYVIWKQRIWDVRTGGGWRTMEDRGSVTQNHFDHCHVSVL
jgi:hypothetical protein